MIKLVSISLLPPEYRQLSALRQKQTRLYFIFGLVSVVLLLIAGAMFFNAKLARSQLNSSFAYREILAQQLKPLAQYEETYTELSSLDQTIQQLKAHRVDWNSFLQDLSQLLPYGVWLTDFRGTSFLQAEEDSAAPEVVLRGGAFDNSLVAELIEGLSQIPGVTNVRCHYSTGGNDTSVVFEITATLSVNSNHEIDNSREAAS